MPGPCDSLKKTREDKLNLLNTFEKKKIETEGGRKQKQELSQDIKKVIKELEQIDKDIKDCIAKQKHSKLKGQKPVKLKPITPSITSLETAHNEPSHGTGSRKQIS